MNFTPAQYEQLFVTYSEFLQKLVESKSYVTPIAFLALQNFQSPNFKDNYWPQFNAQFKKIMDAAAKYVMLDGENELIQQSIRKYLPILRPIVPLEFLSSYKKYYLAENSEVISKNVLKDAVSELLQNLDPMYRYKDAGSNDYTAQFELISVDGKRKVTAYVALGKKDKLEVDVGGYYKDEDFEFEVEELRFDMLQFRSLTNCVNHIMSKISLKASMKINGTRFKIGNHVFVLSSRDLAKAKAEILTKNSTNIFSSLGETVLVNTEGQGKLVDKLALRLLAQGNDKLYYTLVDTTDASINTEAKTEPQTA